jgi:hypothetical protein
LAIGTMKKAASVGGSVVSRRCLSCRCQRVAKLGFRAVTEIAMKVLVAAAALVLLPAALACDYSHQDCAKLQIADCSGESQCPEGQGGTSLPRLDTSPPAAKKAQTHKKSPPAKRRVLSGH